MDYKAAEKALRQSERALEKIRLAIQSAKAVADSHQATLVELESRKLAEIHKAGQSGKLPALGELQHSISDAERKMGDAKAVLATLEQSEQEAIKNLATTEKQAVYALKAAWDVEADRQRAELVRVAGPILAAYFRARYHSNRPVALMNLLRSHGEQLVSDIESAASSTEVSFDLELPEVIESAMLDYQSRKLAA